MAIQRVVFNFDHAFQQAYPSVAVNANEMGLQFGTPLAGKALRFLKAQTLHYSFSGFRKIYSSGHHNVTPFSLRRFGQELFCAKALTK